MYYIYRAYAGREKRVADYLRSAGQDVYLPLEGNNKPFFPGYMFVNADTIDFYALNRTHGGIGVVQFGSYIPMVPDEDVEVYRQTEWVRSEDCAPGSEVIVNSGAFKYMKAIVEAKKGDRIIVLMNVLQSKQRLEFPMKDVVAA